MLWDATRAIGINVRARFWCATYGNSSPRGNFLVQKSPCHALDGRGPARNLNPCETQAWASQKSFRSKMMQ